MSFFSWSATGANVGARYAYESWRCYPVKRCGRGRRTVTLALALAIALALARGLVMGGGLLPGFPGVTPGFPGVTPPGITCPVFVAVPFGAVDATRSVRWKLVL